MERFRVAIITDSGLSVSKNFDIKEEADDWILSKMEDKSGVKYFRILDRKLNKIVEDENGRRK